MRDRGAHPVGSLRGAHTFRSAHRDLRAGRERTLLARDLVGRQLPTLTLLSYMEKRVELPHAGAGGLVIYAYPAADSSPDGAGESMAADAAQHRAFGAALVDFEACSLLAVGLSSESPQVQRDRVLEHRIGHPLWSDPELLVAGALGLPTFTHAAVGCYRRLMLVARGGRIVKAFFPVEDAHRSAAQVIFWARATGG